MGEQHYKKLELLY